MNNSQHIDALDVQAITTDMECEICLCEQALKGYLFGCDEERDENNLHGVRIVLGRLKEQAAEANRALDALYMSR